MHTHSLSINSDPGRALRPWELALLLAVCVTLLTGTWAQARSQLLAACNIVVIVSIRGAGVSTLRTK